MKTTHKLLESEAAAAKAAAAKAAAAQQPTTAQLFFNPSVTSLSDPDSLLASNILSNTAPAATSTAPRHRHPSGGSAGGMSIRIVPSASIDMR